MSAFNILLVDIECIQCHKSNIQRLQFKFGDTWQYTYKLGDKVRWGGNDNGRPHLPSVKVYGILESERCLFCNHFYMSEYDIIISNDIIEAVRPISNLNDYTATLDGNYVITS